ncbi:MULTISPECIES: hypothetical protein [unclassified Paenibacillus]|uniref:hypothetical protein n=1 Tax=unclassified Paenibacillus TaxID=185978 RepID=UPI001AE2028E|nr:MULTISPECIES: hypothetical protein [unclassified Paenibacillus]MBP1156883.1 hypothetical protein [Paenibacillus sp. PvP091]MBP1172378.1 hypothetical protein [Paenibacillus sp. PvR098]MBP2438759.1 hypothetical protein [Paenibacillus sp. PvP052]
MKEQHIWIFEPVNEFAHESSNDGVEDRALQYTLSAVVEEADYDKAVEMIHREQRASCIVRIT